MKANFAEIDEVCYGAKEEAVYTIADCAANDEGDGEFGEAVFALCERIDEHAAHDEGESGEYPALHRAIALEQAPRNTRITDKGDIHRARDFMLITRAQINLANIHRHAKGLYHRIFCPLIKQYQHKRNDKGIYEERFFRGRVHGRRFA